MTKIFVLLLIPILCVTLCCNFVRVIITDDLDNTISFFVITDSLSQVNADMTVLYEGFDDVALWCYKWLGSMGDLTLTLRLQGSFFDIVGGFVKYLGTVANMFVELPELARGLIKAVSGINVLIGDIFMVLNSVFGFTFTWFWE